ncbi:MAG TPA: nucleotide excision repair endonuclease [Chitinivibrionales bacterium]|nr:nucleotide excision repair endonuclease [Chitinivibrionales bacterium]
MHDAMVAYVRAHDGVSSAVLAREILKFKNPDEKLAHAAILAILSKDRRCSFGSDNLWHASALAVPQQGGYTLAETPWAAAYLLALPNNPKAAVYASVWSVAEAPQLLAGRWLEDPSALPFEEQELLRSVRDAPFEDEPRERKAGVLTAACEKRRPVFLSWRQQSAFGLLAQEAGAFLDDSAVLVSTMFVCAKLPLPRPLTLDACHKVLFGTSPQLTYAYKHGECFAKCVQELVRLLTEQGLGDIAHLEAQERTDLAGVDFSGKEFSYDDIAAAPAAPGVYGFKAKNDAYLYIGKASNLRRRLMSYFRDSEESPEKLSRLRAESHKLVTHECGSELEGLIYEYRLIRKHAPLLNTQLAIAERKGAFLPLDDCIVLLPHAEKEKGMSFWFRKNQKILLRPFFSDFRDVPAMETELDKFFFSGALPPSPDDFPEQEIATRWVKQRKDELCIVWVSRSSSAPEVCEMIRAYWKDCSNNF